MALSEKAKAMLVIKDMMPLQEWESFKKKLISEAVSPSHQDLLQVASGLEQLQAAGLVSQGMHHSTILSTLENSSIVSIR